MKKFLTLVIVCSIVLISCKKDDKSSSKNFLKYEGKEFALDKGILENWGKWSVDGDNNIDLSLLSEGVTLVEINNEIDHATGTGHGAQFWMYSTSTTELNSLTYTYDASASEAAGTFEYGYFVINYNFETWVGEVDQDIEGGTVEVAKNGTTYKITINCIDEDGKTLTGSFEGALRYYNYDKKKTTREDKRRF